MKRLWQHAFCLLGLPLLLSLGGCLGYRVGSLAHPQLHTIAIDTVQNDTDQPRLSVLASESLRGQVQNDGSLRLVSGNKADALLKCRILRYEYSSEGAVLNQSNDRDQRTYITNTYGVTCVLRYELYLPGREKPLIGPRECSGKAVFDELADMETSRREAFRQALAEASLKAVKDVVEAW